MIEAVGSKLVVMGMLNICHLETSTCATEDPASEAASRADLGDFTRVLDA